MMDASWPTGRVSPRLIGLGLLVAVTTLTGCRDVFDDTYVLWSRYNGPGGNFWKIEAEADYNIWKSSSASNRMTCERHLNEVQKIHAEMIEKFKKDGQTLGPKDFVCLPKGMHP